MLQSHFFPHAFFDAFFGAGPFAFRGFFTGGSSDSVAERDTASRGICDNPTTRAQGVAFTWQWYLPAAQSLQLRFGMPRLLCDNRSRTITKQRFPSNAIFAVTWSEVI